MEEVRLEVGSRSIIKRDSDKRVGCEVLIEES